MIQSQDTDMSTDAAGTGSGTAAATGGGTGGEAGSGTTPAVVSRYFAAADRRDHRALASCFTEDGTVVDEGITYWGRDEIVGWRESLGTKWRYTSVITRAEALGDHRFGVGVHVEGNFPGGQADLSYSFTLDDDAIVALSIVE